MCESSTRHPRVLSLSRAATAAAIFECWWEPTMEVEAVRESGGRGAEDGDDEGGV